MSDIARPLFGDSAADSVLAPRQLQGVLAGQAGPYVSWLSVDGFGALANLELRDLSPGLNVLLGENEAGKSTLFDFVTGVLFGFPRLKADEHFRSPVNGGRHGGRVGLVEATGDTVVVERHGGPQKQLLVTRADGSAADESDLARLLGGANKDLFQAVFAVDLDDLRRLDGLSSDEVREVLFSSSVVGQRRSAARALRELDSLRDELVKPRQGGKANGLATQLRDARRDLARARAEAARFASLRIEADARSEVVGSLRRDLEAARVEVRDLEVLQRCWTVVVTHRQASGKLEELPRLSADDLQALQTEPNVTALRVALSGHIERLEQFEETQAQRSGLERSIKERVETLGPWAIEVAGSASINLESLRDQLEERAAGVAAATVDRNAARGLLAGARAELPLENDEGGTGAVDTPPVPDSVELEGRVEALRELRGLAAETEALAREVEHDAERERIRRTAVGNPKGASAFEGAPFTGLVSALVLGLIAGVLVSRGQTAVAVIAGLAAAAFVVASVTSIVARRRKIARPEAEVHATVGNDLPDFGPERHDRLQALRQRLTQQAVECELPEPVVLVSVQRAMDHTELQLAERRRLDDRARVEGDLSRRCRAATTKLENADRALAAELDAVSCVAERWGLPVSQDTAGLLRLVSQLVELRERMAAIRRIDAEARADGDEIRRFEAGLHELADSLGLLLDPAADNLQVSGDELERLLRTAENLVTAARALSAQRAELESEQKGAESELDRVLGEGVHADRLRADLSSGLVLEWEARATAAAERVRCLEEQYELVLREHEGLVLQLDELVRSDAIAVLEQRCHELEAELDATMKSYLTTSGARLLVHRTLRRYEAERQPAVLAGAGEHFARVTDGRYQRLVVDSAPDGSNPTVQVVKENGSLIDATALSRGTIEQLYLCLRLALAESFADRYLPLPIVLDDVLVNFDPARARSVVDELIVTADRHQVLFLTCHPHLAELVSGRAPRAAVKELPRI